MEEQAVSALEGEEEESLAEAPADLEEEAAEAERQPVQAEAAERALAEEFLWQTGLR